MESTFLDELNNFPKNDMINNKSNYNGANVMAHDKLIFQHNEMKMLEVIVDNNLADLCICLMSHTAPNDDVDG